MSDYFPDQHSSDKRSKSRFGFDALLKQHPTAEIAEVWNQEETIRQSEERHRQFQSRVIYRHHGIMMGGGNGPWLCVDIFVDGRLERYAIWRETGNVYRLDEIGAVEDDPFITITELATK